MADGQRSSDNSEASHHQMNELKDLLGQAMIRLGALENKVEELQEEAVSQGRQIRRLEAKITGKVKYSNELTSPRNVKKIFSIDVIVCVLELGQQDQEETIDAVRTIVPEEKETRSNKQLTSHASLGSATSMQSNSEGLSMQMLQSLALNDTGAVSTNTGSQNKSGSKTITDDNRSVAPKPAACATGGQTRIGNRVFARWMDSTEDRLSIWKDNDYGNSLLSYIAKMFGQQATVHQIIRPLRLGRTNDDELDQLHRVISTLEEQDDAREALHAWQTDTRSTRRLDDLRSIFEGDNPSLNNGLCISTSLPPGGKIIDRQSIKAYFDLICRDGFITAQVGSYLQLSKENIFGGDDYDSHNPNFTHIKVNLENSTIDLADNRVDLITCLVVLHHVPRLQEMLAQLARILRPKGYLILREHDCKKERSLQAKYMNFIHAFMMIARVGEFAHSSTETPINPANDQTDWERQKAEIIQYTSTIEYRTRKEWQKELKEVGFHCIAAMDYPANGRGNPQALYYEIYQLNKK